jgi:UDP-3-O-[3-hydroxymyristoyl] glucosamine N-acyltransferase
VKLSEIADILDGELIGDPNTEIKKAGKIESAGNDDITFIANPLYEKYLKDTDAGAVIVSKSFVPRERTAASLIKVEDPYLSFVKILEIIVPAAELLPPGIDKTAIVSGSAIVGKGVSIGSHCYVGAGCVIGDNCKLLPNTVVMNDVEIGSESIIHPSVTIYHGCKIGNKVIVHSGTVIGCDGFGHVPDEDKRFRKIPQTGIVVIEDNVEIGSNCCIDRATMGETKICRGVKLDNQIQIAHNVYIGENTVIAAQTGIAGSAKIGKNCMIGGKVGIVGHVEICDNVIITAAANVSKSIMQAGTYSGYRAQPMAKELREQARLRRLIHLKRNNPNL